MSAYNYFKIYGKTDIVKIETLNMKNKILELYYK